MVPILVRYIIVTKTDVPKMRTRQTQRISFLFVSLIVCLPELLREVVMVEGPGVAELLRQHLLVQHGEKAVQQTRLRVRGQAPLT